MASLATTNSSASSTAKSNSIKANASSTNTTQLDVDQLARDKVEEVERWIESVTSVKLDSINSWLAILKQIITAADLHRSNDKNEISPDHHKTNPNHRHHHHQNNHQQQVEESIYADFGDDNEQFNAVDLSEQFATNSVKWTIRVRAFKLVHKVVQLLTKTSSFQLNQSSKSPLFKHLADLIRLSFVAATSPYDDLKLQGFEMFKVLINMFALVEEREFPGHSILEQYKTQVLSAIKPAFDFEAPPYITAIASQVCCLWLCLGLEKNKSDLKRTFQLMTATIDKLENQSSNQNSKLYTESELEQERLDILGSWAQLYIISKRMDLDSSYHGPIEHNCKKNIDCEMDSTLGELVQPQIGSLINKWWEALKDYALIIMPSTKAIALSHDNEQVYTRDVALRLFESVWPKLILASTIWLCSSEKSSKESDKNGSNESTMDNAEVPEVDLISDSEPESKDSKIKYFKFICGIIMKELYRFLSETVSCNENEAIRETLPEKTVSAIRSLYILVNISDFESALPDQLPILQEFYTIIYSILLFTSRTKSQHNQMLKHLLDRLFTLGLRKITTKPDHITYSVVKLIKSIDNNMMSLQESLTSKSDDYEQQKLKLYLRYYNLITIVRLEPELATQQEDIREALFTTFQSILSFTADLSVSLSYLNLLKDLHKYVPNEHSSEVLVNLFNVKIEIADKLYDLTKVGENADKNTLYLDAYSKFIEQDITFAINDTRLDFLKKYSTMLIEKLPPCQESTTNSKPMPQTETRLFDLILKNVNVLKASYEFDLSMLSKDLQDKYNSAVELQQVARAKLENEQRKIAQASKKPPMVNSNKPDGKPATKIVLKADFSNFYSKKS